ncbi:bile acid:sodium symporter [Congregibacter brevis]|uniref:Bile acid:sodium symporter n=1 Tax=Congregibacter brevis TaxID=3081201 RepID=A0ABZ0I738_9GAMM|nr:bile acid:sodium symporter [Congregibacter sp. IMCC45268]
MGEIYIEYEYWIAVFQLVMAMLGMGATLTLAHFRDVLLEPRAVTVGIVIQVVLVPLIAFLCIWSLGVVGGVAVGIALIAAIPGGTTSNIFTHFARGNTALSITITALTTLACLVTTPLILGLLIAQYMPDDFVMPRQRVMIEIAMTLLLPLAVGMGYLRCFPRTAEAFSKLCVRSSLLGIAAIIVGSSMSGRLDVGAFGLSNLGVIILFILALVLASILACKILGLSSVDATAIDMEVVVRNINLGVLIKASLFPAITGQPDPMGDFVLFSLLVYGGVQMLVAAVFIVLRRPKHA